MPVLWLDGMPREEGVSDLVIAWTLRPVSFDRNVGWQYGMEWTIPMKRACKH